MVNAGRGLSHPGERAAAIRDMTFGPNPNVTVSREGFSASHGSWSHNGARPWVRAAASSESTRSMRRRESLLAPLLRSNAMKAEKAWGSVATPACRAP